MGKVTLQSIADRLGVSRMTVSNAFSRPDQLSSALRERILAEASALGYLGPDPAARSLATGTTGSIGVLWSADLRHALTDEVSARFLGAVADELAPAGLALTILPAGVDGPVVPARDVAIDGAIAFSCDPELAALDLLRQRGMPLVYVDVDAPRSAVSVTIDDREGARAAAQHVIDLGRRRIALLTSGFSDVVETVPGPPRRPVTRTRVQTERYAGWLDALDAAGLVPLVVNEPNTYGGARSAAALLFAGPEPPDAVCCLTDVAAQSVLSAAEDAGLRVPEDVAVVGFDDHPLALRTRPTLTTIRQDVDAKGRAAVTALLALLARRTDPTVPMPSSVRLGVDLIVRGSTEPVNEVDRVLG